MLFLLFLPETCRKVVGNGSIPPPLLNQSLTDIIRQRNRVKAGDVVDAAQLESVRKNYHLAVPNPLSTLIIAADKEPALILFVGGLIVALFYAVNVGIPSQFADIYGYNELELGLVYLPFGAGGVISAFTTGKMMDRNYRRHAKRNGYPLVKNRYQDLTNFPIERARLEIAMPLFYLSVIGLIGYGWLLYARTNLAGPLILLFVWGYGSMAAFQVMMILIVDIRPGEAAAATAANNLFRCLLGAGSTAVVVPMINRLNVGWTYTLSALLWMCFSPLLWVLMKYGPMWRKEKKAKQEQKIRDEAESRDSVNQMPEKTSLGEPAAEKDEVKDKAPEEAQGENVETK